MFYCSSPQTDGRLTDPWNEVVLQVQDPQLPAPPVDVLDLLDVLLMQRDFLQREDLTLVVLGPPANHVLCDWTDTQTSLRPGLLL